MYDLNDLNLMPHVMPIINYYKIKLVRIKIMIDILGYEPNFSNRLKLKEFFIMGHKTTSLLH